MMYYGTEMNALNFGVKRSKFKVRSRYCTGGGIQYSMSSRVVLDFLVCLIGHFFWLGPLGSLGSLGRSPEMNFRESLEQKCSRAACLPVDQSTASKALDVL